MTQRTDGDAVYLSMGTPGGREVFVQPQLTMPRPTDAETAAGPRATDQKADADMFVSYFWAVPIGNAQQKDRLNMKVVFEDVKITSMEVKVPIMTNTVPLDVGDHLLVEPYNKKPKRD